MSLRATLGHARATSLCIGGLAGIFILHPVAMVVAWMELPAEIAHDLGSVGDFVSARMAASFTLSMAPMTIMFAAIGAFIGWFAVTMHARLQRDSLVIARLEREVSRDISALVGLGETERVAFKATARWNPEESRVDEACSELVVRTIAAFANHEGGSILIGIGEDGRIVGLESDYGTLKKTNRDGFEQHIMALVRERLGGHACDLVHVVFTEVDSMDVCRVVVEPASAPVYLADDERARFFIRTGTASRELEAREAVEYVSRHWKARSRSEVA